MYDFFDHVKRQKAEIATIKERTLKIKLSDADVKRITEQCAYSGITVADLYENFIGDLVGGTYTNGSDERDFAERYYRRCWFGLTGENFVQTMIDNHGTYVIGEIITRLDIIDDCIEDMKKDLSQDEKTGALEELEYQQKEIDEYYNEYVESAGTSAVSKEDAIKSVREYDKALKTMQEELGIDPWDRYK